MSGATSMDSNNATTINKNHRVKFIDLFCGIGGFRIAAGQAACQYGVTANCVFSSDIDKACQHSYEANFRERPFGDIAKIHASSIPKHDLLLAGFPCQPFSVMGKLKGFNDTRGTLFFEIARVIADKKPMAFVLENVKALKGHDKGKTMRRILDVLKGLGYACAWRVLNALDFGLPQKRERVFIVGFREERTFAWPKGGVKMRSLSEVLEKDVPKSCYASEHIQRKRLAKHPHTIETTIWHENKAGNIGVYPFSCALRAGASYNYLLVNGKRRLTSREMLRLQGFPDSFKIVCNSSQTRKQAGNSLPVPVAQAVISSVFAAQEWRNGKHLKWNRNKINSNQQ